MDELWIFNLATRKIEVGIGTSFREIPVYTPIIIEINSNT